MEPLPNGRVEPREPSDRYVNVPEPNFCVAPVRGLLIELLGGFAAKESVATATMPRTTEKAATVLIILPLTIPEKSLG